MGVVRSGGFRRCPWEAEVPMQGDSCERPAMEDSDGMQLGQTSTTGACDGPMRSPRPQCQTAMPHTGAGHPSRAAVMDGYDGQPRHTAGETAVNGSCGLLPSAVDVRDVGDGPLWQTGVMGRRETQKCQTAAIDGCDRGLRETAETYSCQEWP
jgi:hypothetical protein